MKSENQEQDGVRVSAESETLRGVMKKRGGAWLRVRRAAIEIGLAIGRALEGAGPSVEDPDSTEEGELGPEGTDGPKQCRRILWPSVFQVTSKSPHGRAAKRLWGRGSPGRAPFFGLRIA